MGDVAHSPWAEVAWYLPDSREQFRLLGRLTVVDAQTEDAALQQASRRGSWERGRCGGELPATPPDGGGRTDRRCSAEAG